jgi:hypothetical protein
MLNRNTEIQNQSLNFDTSIDFNDLSRYRPEVDYLEKSTNVNVFQTISKFIRMTNPREWLFILFFSSIITSKLNLTKLSYLSWI